MTSATPNSSLSQKPSTSLRSATAIPHLVKPKLGGKTLGQRSSVSTAHSTKTNASMTSYNHGHGHISHSHHSLTQEDTELAASGYGFCHHCKQVKSKYLLARCNYNSAKMGHTVPASYTVRDVKIYNSKYKFKVKSCLYS
jgi:hypothetical protein